MIKRPSRLIRALPLAALLCAQAQGSPDQDLRYLGHFHNVLSRDGGDHCQGYSLGLWRFRDHLVGLLDVHAGLCGDPPCGAIGDAVLEGSTGRLRFSSSIGGRKVEFDGTWTPAAVEGTLDGKPARLERDRDAPSADFAPNRSFAAWCELWGSVPRCAGVRDLCRSLRGPAARAAKDSREPIECAMRLGD